MYAPAYARPLPNLRQKPSFVKIYETLESLASTSTRGHAFPGGSQEELQFLLSITTSSLDWLHQDVSTEVAQERKDALYDLAAKRIAERCGRNAISEINRTFVVPLSTQFPEIRIDLREPGIVEDNLGLKTWGTAHAMAMKLEELRDTVFSHLLCSGQSTHEISLPSGGSYLRVKTRVLELGAGTGLLGIAISKIWQCTVIATDLPRIQENLHFNVRRNQTQHSGAVGTSGTHGHVMCEILDWKCSAKALAGYDSKAFEIIVAADPIYDDEHPQLVASMVKKYLAHTTESRALIAVPIRDKYSQKKAASLREFMAERGLALIHEGEGEFCDPDWTDSEGNEIDAVKLWYGIWRVIVSTGLATHAFNSRLCRQVVWPTS